MAPWTWYCSTQSPIHQLVCLLGWHNRYPYSVQHTHRRSPPPEHRRRRVPRGYRATSEVQGAAGAEIPLSAPGRSKMRRGSQEFRPALRQGCPGWRRSRGAEPWTRHRRNMGSWGFELQLADCMSLAVIEQKTNRRRRIAEQAIEGPNSARFRIAHPPFWETLATADWQTTAIGTRGKVAGERLRAVLLQPGTKWDLAGRYRARRPRFPARCN